MIRQTSTLYLAIVASIFSLVLISTYGYSQKVKHITNRFPNSKIVAEEYYVLKSNKRMKHGEYTSYHKCPRRGTVNGVRIENKIKQHGFYVNGKKDGPWTETTAAGREEKGNYTKGVRTGIWDTYNNSIKMGSYDYTLGRRIGSWLYSDGKLSINHNYETGEIKTKPILSHNLSYPRKARDAGIQGTVIMQFHLTPNCTFDDIKIIQSVSPECDEEALKCLKFMEKAYQQEESCTDGVKTFSIDFILN